MADMNNKGIQDTCESYNYPVYKAEEFFRKTIPFNVYRLSNLWGMVEHTHNYIQIWYVQSGCCQHIIGSTSHNLTKGSLFVVPPFISHKIMPVEGEVTEILGCEFLYSFINDNMGQYDKKNSLFDFAYLEPFLVSNQSLKPRLHLTGKVQVKVEELFTDMLEEYNKEDKYYEINIKADLLKLLAIIAREYEVQNDKDSEEIFDKYRDAVNSSIDYLNKNYTEDISIEEICKIAMMSQTYFSHIFKQITGKTFVEYKNDLRINKAVELLMENKGSISEISTLVGFNDISYFNKVFKRITGLSPSHYKKLTFNLLNI